MTVQYEQGTTNQTIDASYLKPLSTERWCHVPSWGAIRLSCKDVHQFLQGQVTCQMNLLSDSQCLLGAHCNVKGRAIANFLIVSWSGETLLAAPKSNLANLSSSLKKYGLFNRLEVSDTDILLSLHQKPSSTLSPVQSVSPFAVRQTQNELVIALSQETQLRLARAQVSLNLPPCDPQLWTLVQFELGLPFLEAQLSEKFIPNELNMDHNGGISFDKGCYIGQEIIARLHYRSEPKYRVYRLTLPEKSPLLKPSEQLLLEGKSFGTIINCTQTQTGEGKALAILKSSFVTQALGQQLQRVDPANKDDITGLLAPKIEAIV